MNTDFNHVSFDFMNTLVTKIEKTMLDGYWVT